MNHRLLAVALVAVASSGCATLVNGTSQRIAVSSDPAGAAVVVRCANLERRHGEPTPTEVRLSRRATACALDVSKAGYRPVTVELVKKVSALAIGNVVTCGCGLMVDALTGGMFAFVPGSVEVTLQPDGEQPEPQ